MTRSMNRAAAAAHARDWPLPHRVWELFVWLVLIAVLSIAARESYGAERPQPGAAQSAPAPAPAHLDDAAPTTTDDLFDDLAAVEDPTLADHVAAGLSAGELALVIVFLILLFPVGIILLIVFLVDD